MATLPEVDFEKIRGLGAGGRRDGFEEFVCQLARQDPRIPAGSAFERFRGAGGDGGVEAIVRRPDRKEWGWQCKYFFTLDKGQIDKSVTAALDVHPNLFRYTIAIPFDPTAIKKGPGTSDIQKIDTWKKEWEQLAANRAMTVDFEVLWAHDLRDRLLAWDKTGSRVRYWFDKDVLPESWWKDRLDEAVNAARPRYVPELRVDVPVIEGFHALLLTAGWVERTQQIQTRLDDKSRAVAYRPKDSPAPPQDLSLVVAAVAPATTAFEAWRAAPAAPTRSAADAALRALRHALAAAETEAADKLEKKFGAGIADSQPWRQERAAYQADFPAETLDRIRELQVEVTAALELLASATGELAGAPAGLLIGKAGVGKTYAVVDWASDRLSEGAPTLVLHGRWFSECADPLPKLRELMRLPPDVTPEDALALLDHAGEVAGVPCLLVIDALNETAPRSIWRNHLDRLANACGKLPHLRLLLTVRTHYRAEVVPSGVLLPAWEHRGFEHLELEALFEYAQYYSLEPPAAPPAQREFANPLFLRLLCEALKGAGRTQVDADMGIAEVIDLLIETKNQSVSDRLDSPPLDRIVPRAVREIARAMNSAGRLWLDRAAAQAITRQIWSGQKRDDSLLEALIAEGVLSEDRVATQGSANTVVDVVAFAFERLAQHIVVAAELDLLADQAAVAESLTAGPLRSLAFPNGLADPGLLEALSIELSRRHGAELEAVLPGVPENVEATLSGLAWRTATSVGASAVAIVEAALADPAKQADVLDLAFSLAPREKHPLNADWSYTRIVSFPLPRRDAMLVPWFYDRRGTGGSVDMLVSWALRASLKGVRAETARLWATSLLWCTASADRRVRDAATRGLVRLFAAHPAAAVATLARFIAIDDDWSVERALFATYGGLLCTSDASQWAPVAKIVWEGVFANAKPPSANVLIRDTARCLLEEAVARGHAPSGFDSARIKPPHSTRWPTTWPDVASIEPLREKHGYPQIVSSCTIGEAPNPPMPGDFGRYQLESLVRGRGLDVDAAKRWLVHEVAAIGYTPSLHAKFDLMLINTFGRERGRPKVIERIGKKYQWVALARLAGLVDDHTTAKPDSWDAPPMAERTLQGASLRDIDPTILVSAPPEELRSEQPPWVPNYDWPASVPLADSKWVAIDDIPDPPLTIPAQFIRKRERVVVSGSYEWRTEPPRGSQYPYRVIWTHLHGVLVAAKDRKKLVEHYEGRSVGNDQPEARRLTEKVFAGEFPFGVPMRQVFHILDHEGRTIDDAPVDAWPAVYDLGGEYEYDGTAWTNVGLLLPSERFFGPSLRGLRWNGRGGWLDGETLVAMNTMPLNRNELSMDREWLEAWLLANQMEMIWVDLSEKNVIDGGRSSSPRMLSRSRVWWRDKRGLQVTKAFITTG